jgi:hypothetical protein
MRFFCGICGENLKLSEDSLKWLLARAIEAAPVVRETRVATEPPEAPPGEGGASPEGAA